jgi:flagellin-like hook-associated protein FlgL
MELNKQLPGEQQRTAIEEILTQLIHQMQALNVDFNSRMERIESNVTNLNQRTTNLEDPNVFIPPPPPET